MFTEQQFILVKYLVRERLYEMNSLIKAAKGYDRTELLNEKRILRQIQKLLTTC